MSKARKTYMEEFKREAVSLLEKRVNKRQAEVNLFVDHSQLVQRETLRRRIWGTKDVWGRVLTYKE